MFEPEEVRGIERALAGWIRRAGKDDPEAFAQMVAIIDGAKAQLVDAAADLRGLTDSSVVHRMPAHSWAELGAALGVTRAAAQKRFGRKA